MILRAMGFTTGVVVGATVTFCLMFLFVAGYFRGTPDIGLDLPLGRDEANAVLTERFRKRFPVGVSVSSLVEILSEEGFKPNYHCPTNAHGASYYRPGLCAQIWTVDWMPDDQGNVRSIEATYLNYCS